MNKSKKEPGQSESESPGNIQKATRKNANDGPGTIESLLPTGSGERAAAGIAAAAGGALLASAAHGLGPAALPGAAGYVAYREMSEGPKKGKARTASLKRSKS
jgi:hypothetical protein